MGLEDPLAKAIRRRGPGVRALFEPETLEALQTLHPSGEGLPATAPVRAAPLTPEECAVEVECRRMPVASRPACSQPGFEHLDLIFGAADGAPAIQHAGEQIVSNREDDGQGGLPAWCAGSLRGQGTLRRLRRPGLLAMLRRPGFVYGSGQGKAGLQREAEVCAHKVQAGADGGGAIVVPP
ncbi:hypothetical protein CYMTET_14131 [Cymbomonas tetramitiformis]|uniref:Uncharacterized protein n=1 Tax=Cymbomonas tetramitiformis TaxID=36881 RepID=A0AAE0LAP4_9CHLO|nr:hypothetical protein CYMTET_14131 [Cymbomonas tetramitiformis]